MRPTAIVLILLIAAALAPNLAGAREAAVRRYDPTSGPVIVSCDTLPADAVRKVPPPFDRYMELGCTHAGEALKPMPGYSWVFQQGPMWLLATTDAQKAGHFTMLESHSMSDAEKAALMSELAKIVRPGALSGWDIIRLDVQMSSGDKKQEYLLLPPADGGPKVNVLGMECIQDCKPIDKDPWFFVVAPDK